MRVLARIAIDPEASCELGEAARHRLAVHLANVVEDDGEACFADMESFNRFMRSLAAEDEMRWSDLRDHGQVRPDSGGTIQDFAAGGQPRRSWGLIDLVVCAETTLEGLGLKSRPGAPAPEIVSALDLALARTPRRARARAHRPIGEGESIAAVWSQRFDPLLPGGEVPVIVLLDRYAVRHGGDPRHCLSIRGLKHIIGRVATGPTLVPLHIVAEMDPRESGEKKKKDPNRRDDIEAIRVVWDALGSTTRPQMTALLVDRTTARQLLHDRWMLLLTYLRWEEDAVALDGWGVSLGYGVEVLGKDPIARTCSYSRVRMYERFPEPRGAESAQLARIMNALLKPPPYKYGWWKISWSPSSADPRKEWTAVRALGKGGADAAMVSWSYDSANGCWTPDPAYAGRS